MTNDHLDSIDRGADSVRLRGIFTINYLRFYEMNKMNLLKIGLTNNQKYSFIIKPSLDKYPLQSSSAATFTSEQDPQDDPGFGIADTDPGNFVKNQATRTYSRKVKIVLGTVIAFMFLFVLDEFFGHGAFRLEDGHQIGSIGNEVESAGSGLQFFFGRRTKKSNHIVHAWNWFYWSIAKLLTNNWDKYDGSTLQKQVTELEGSLSTLHDSLKEDKGYLVQWEASVDKCDNDVVKLKSDLKDVHNNNWRNQSARRDRFQALNNDWTNVKNDCNETVSQDVEQHVCQGTDQSAEIVDLTNQLQTANQEHEAAEGALAELEACTADCQHGQSKINDGGACSCACFNGFTGIKCDVIDKCRFEKPCQNGGKCTVDGQDSYKCACAAGFSGTNCENNVDDCRPMPCQNGGACVDGVDSYSILVYNLCCFNFHFVKHVFICLKDREFGIEFSIDL